MRKKAIVRISWMLIMALLLSVVPVESIYAATVVSEQIDEEQNQTEQVNMEDMFNYLLINQPEQQVGDEQTIVISLGEGSEHVEAMEMYVKDEAGTVITLKPEKNEAGAYLFQKSFAKGLYYIDSVKLTVSGTEETYVMSEMGINACFSVGTDCPEEEKSEHLEVESIPTEEPEVETTIVTMDENGSGISQEIIAEAVEEAIEEAEVKSEVSMSTYASSRAVKEEVVIVLDPGHDSTHTGASYNGIKEHVVTLKIAKYCKKELETYGGIKVYLTREDAACPYPGSTDNLHDIRQRVKAAYEKGADAYVSIHLNASSSTSAKGAEVYYHSDSTTGKKLSQQVQDELLELGLNDRGVKINDKYTVTKTAQSYGFPGIIIEHAFMSNKSDVEKYLSSESKLNKLGVADATGIAEHFSLSKIGTKVAMTEAAYTITNAAVKEQVLSVGEEGLTFAASEGLASQRFELVSAGNDYYYLTAEGTGKVLGVTGGTVQLEDKNTDSANQKWLFLESASEYYYLYSASGHYLAVDECGLVVADTADASTQQWQLEKASYRPVEGLTPKLVSVKNSGGAVVIKWKDLTGADGYFVYRKTEGETWKRVATIKGETKTSYTDKMAPESTKCTYTVKAYKGDTQSLYNKKGISVTTPAKKTYIKYRTTTSVNYRTGAGTNYSKAGTLAKSKVIDVEKEYAKTVNGLKWYRFKKDSKEYYIAAKYLIKDVKPSAPQAVSAKYSSGAVTFKWKKVANAEGYYIYRRLHGEKYERFATVKSGNIVQYKDKTVKKGKTYRYLVRAYNGSKISGYQEGISVKIPKETLVKYKTKTKVKYRTGAGTKYSAKGTIKKGKTVSVVKGWSKKVNGLKWYKVKINGKYYYMAAKYLKKK